MCQTFNFGFPNFLWEQVFNTKFEPNPKLSLFTIVDMFFLGKDFSLLMYFYFYLNHFENEIFQVVGEKDQDGFYWGELRGRRGFVPHNMVSEIDDNQNGSQGIITNVGEIRSSNGVNGFQQSMRNVSRDRWGDIYCNMPVKRMIALYDYDPQELSPNVDAEVLVFLYLFHIITKLSQIQNIHF